MRAIGFNHSLPIADENALQMYELPIPTPGDHDILVRVHACAVNPIDAKLRASKQPSPSDTPHILGWDAAGEVIAVGNHVQQFTIGDTVYYAGALNRPGCNAEYQVVAANLAAHAPATLELTDAAAIPLTALTAWELLFDSMGISPGNPRANQGKSILIINGAGGVGSMAIQLAKWSGLHVVATASRPKSVLWCRRMGADVVIDHQRGLQHACDNISMTGFDYIACLTNSEAYWQDMSHLIHPFGAIGLITSLKADVNINPFKDKCARLCWEFMFCRSVDPTQHSKQAAILAEIAALIDIGQLQATKHTTLTGLTVENFQQAHQLMESGQAIGKCVIDFDASH